MVSDQFHSFAQELITMESKDQAMYAKALADITLWDPNIKRTNSERLKEIIDQIGWPTVHKVGEIAARAAFTLAQHTHEDLAFMQQCLEMVKETGEDKILPIPTAFLEDLTRILAGELQIYGTQFRPADNDNGFEPYPIANPEQVDARRAAIGLDTLAENAELIREMHQGHAE